ncbi:hypothetical protein [Brevibacillus reuszeri]|uniref:hypothetical protein n=1 Tax=Brevibacillus reuszeri TaxID=54915 RepID=UPI003D1DB321
MDSNQEFIVKFKLMSEVLMDYGWFASPYMMGLDFDSLHTFCQALKEQGKVSDVDKKDIQDRVNDYMLDVMFHPNYRAFYMIRGKDLPHIQEFSHHLERAVIHYYKQDYLSCVLCLLPAVEGLLLSLYGWQYGESRKPSQKELIGKITERVDVRFTERYEMYALTVSSFLEKWILSDTRQADFDVSFLNRHYVLHGMGQGNFYAASDCHRLFLLFDLLIEMLSIRYEKYYGLIPSDNFNLNIRREYYIALMNGSMTQKDMVAFEKTLMNEHKNFHEEKNPPNWTNLELKHMLKMMEIFESRNRIKRE